MKKNEVIEGISRFCRGGIDNRPASGTKARPHRKAIAAMLPLMLLSSIALPQAANDKIGFVMAEKSPQPGSAQSSSYSRFVDPVDGLTADDVVQRAMAANGDLQAARLAITSAQAMVKQAGLKPNPMIEAGRTQTLNTPDNNVMVGAEWPLELGGRRKARIQVAERELEMRRSEVADFERKLAAEVRMKYSDVIAAARNLKFTEDMLALTRDSHRLVSVRVGHGKSAPLEQNLLAVELNRVEAMKINFEGRTEVAMLELKKVAGINPDEPVRVRGEFAIDRQPVSKEEALRQALEKRPDLAAMRAAELVAEAQTEQARVEGKYDASFFASYERMRSGFDVMGVNNSGALAPVEGIFHNLTVGFKIMLPVRNKNQGSVEAAVAQQEAARKRREFAELVARSEVNSAYVRFERAKEALAIYRDGVRDQALKNLDVVRQTYVLGQKTALDYVAEQRRFVEVETGYTEVLKEYFDAMTEIERVTAAAAPSSVARSEGLQN
jgi:cobalt-zinc-cadmium efflux system outer membrane protein